MVRHKSKDINWDQFGLNKDTTGATDEPGEADGNDRFMAAHRNELYHDEQTNMRPWWRANFFISERVLFGTWDGVYTSCVIHLIGVIVFLRAGYIVGNAGILLSVCVVTVSVTLCSIAVLSGINISERCNHTGGTLHSLLSYVLGGQLSGAITLVYCFGQAVSCALHVMGFAESIAAVMKLNDPWLERVIGVTLILLLLFINVAGVKWVVRLQFILLLVLMLAAVDFTVGIFVKYDPSVGVTGFTLDTMEKNLEPKYESSSINLYTIFGIFFPSVTGVFAGINMSGDLHNPKKDIPTGTFAAIGTSLVIYLTFIVGLGSVCERHVLLSDFMIAEKVSALGVFFVAGIYVSSMSSCLGAIYATPRIIQSMALENVIPGMKILSLGKGPNKVPVYALILFSLVTFAFIMIRSLNILATIVTIPFLLTYASIEYSYFSLAMTFDIQRDREARYMATGELSRSSSEFSKGKGKKYTDYGATKDSDLDRLFPERVTHRQDEKPSIKRQLSSPTTTESSPVTSPDDHSSIKSVESSHTGDTTAPATTPVHNCDLMFDEVKRKSGFWYSILTNRWIALIAAIIKLVIMFLVQWGYALSAFMAIAFFWYYIGQVNPGIFPGITQFKLLPWLKQLLLKCCGKYRSPYEQIVVTSADPVLDVVPSHLTSEGTDYATREKYHQATSIKTNP